MATTKRKITTITKAAWRRWVAALRPRTRIVYTDNHNCAVARFLKEETGREVFVNSERFHYPGDVSLRSMPREFYLPTWLTDVLDKVEWRFTGRQLKQATEEVIGL